MLFKTFRAKPRLRPIAALAIAGLAAAALAGCSSGSGSSSSSGSATSGTVNWWGWTPELATAKTYIAAFNKVYPKIKVTYKQVTIADWEASLRPALASPSSPDVFDIQPGAYVTEFQNYAEDLTPVVKKALGSDWKSKVAPIGTTGLTTSTGKLAALSVGSTFAGNLWINKDLFTKYNVTPPTTLAQWVKDCATFKQNGVGCFVQGAAQEGFNQDTLQSIADSVEPGLWTKASKGDAKWNDPNMVKTLSIWHELFTDGIMQPGAVGTQQYPDANNDFLNQKYAMVMMGTWYMQYATTKGMTAGISAAGVATPKTFPIVPIPFPAVAGSGSKGGAMFGDSDYGLAVASKSKNKAAAETFVSWLTTSKAGQQAVADELDDIPSLNGVAPNWNKIQMPDKSIQQAPVQNIIKQTDTVSEARESLLSTAVQNAILAASTSVATGSASPQAAADTLQSAAVASGEKFK
jgi:ABC-type glycerol-3-phosphate transport system substrate-binding protein